ncbi:transaldolase [Candidatus Daviesbacteria bacterium]|nr:transaldolase [Candidatus Daviesbacteria bacterium]
MRPANLKSKIFLDSGDTDETKQILDALGFLDGQTTNPTLIAKNPTSQKRLAEGKKFSKDEVYSFYKDVVEQIFSLIPNGSVSVEVYADANTSSEEMFIQGKRMFFWIPNAHIKYPTIKAGLKAASRSIKEGMRVNMTLCFSQQQAAAVYAATKGAKKGDVFVSPFVGRLDDRGENGMEFIKNVIQMYKGSDGHMEVLTASVRNLDHLLYAIQLGSDIITSPFKILLEWSEKGLPMPDENFTYSPDGLKNILYEEISLDKDWSEYDLSHPLTDAGIERFSGDWNNLIK